MVKDGLLFTHSSSMKTQRRVSTRSADFSDAPGVWTLASRKPAHRAINSLELSPASDSRIGAGTLMNGASNPKDAAILALRAPSRATLNSRIVSTTQSADLIVAWAVPVSAKRSAAPHSPGLDERSDDGRRNFRTGP